MYIFMLKKYQQVQTGTNTIISVNLRINKLLTNKPSYNIDERSLIYWLMYFEYRYNYQHPITEYH